MLLLAGKFFMHSDQCMVFSKIVQQGVQNIQKYQYLADTYKDPLVKAKLSALRCAIIECEPFLRRFQTQKPLASFLRTSLYELVHLLRKVIKLEKISEIDSLSKLLYLDLSHTI